jgi:hypothetical protein
MKAAQASLWGQRLLDIKPGTSEHEEIRAQLDRIYQTPLENESLEIPLSLSSAKERKAFDEKGPEIFQLEQKLKTLEEQHKEGTQEYKETVRQLGEAKAGMIIDRITLGELAANPEDLSGYQLTFMKLQMLTKSHEQLGEIMASRRAGEEYDGSPYEKTRERQPRQSYVAILLGVEPIYERISEAMRTRTSDPYADVIRMDKEAKAYEGALGSAAQKEQLMYQTSDVGFERRAKAIKVDEGIAQSSWYMNNPEQAAYDAAFRGGYRKPAGSVWAPWSWMMMPWEAKKEYAQGDLPKGLDVSDLQSTAKEFETGKRPSLAGGASWQPREPPVADATSAAVQQQFGEQMVKGIQENAEFAEKAAKKGRKRSGGSGKKS